MVPEHLNYRTNPALAVYNPVLSAQFVNTALSPRAGENLTFKDIVYQFERWRDINGFPPASTGKIQYWLSRELTAAGFQHLKHPETTYLNVHIEPAFAWPKLEDMVLPFHVEPPKPIEVTEYMQPDVPEFEPGMVEDLDIDRFIKEHISLNDRGQIYRSDVLAAYRFWLHKQTGERIQVSSVGPQMKRFDFIMQSQGFIYRVEGQTKIYGAILTAPAGCKLRRSSAAPLTSLDPVVTSPDSSVVEEFLDQNIWFTEDPRDATFTDAVLDRLCKWLSNRQKQHIKVEYSDRIYQLVAKELKTRGSWGFKNGKRAYRCVLLKETTSSSSASYHP